MRKTLTYTVAETEPYINWIYFHHAWGMGGKPDEAKNSLQEEAVRTLHELQNDLCAKVVFGLYDANSDGDDLMINGIRFPLLRQQTPSENGFCLCLADFVRPISSGIKDKIGLFATSVDSSAIYKCNNDSYKQMMVQILSDRIAEAAAEIMHLEVRKNYWGYAPDENLSIDELHLEKYQGIRPAIGYPLLPDMGMNFVLDSILNIKDIGITLTDSGMMIPHACVSGLMISHPQARYFNLGKIGEDQLHDYARRRGLPSSFVRKFVESSLIKK